MAGNCIYFAFGVPPVTGGDFVSLEHIVGLGSLGFHAQALDVSRDQSLEFSVPLSRIDVEMKKDDIVVIGENQKKTLDRMRDAPCIKVLHCQAPYYTFFGFDSIAALNAYPFTRIIVSSDFTAAKLAEMGVTHPVSRVRPGLPPFFATGPKRLQIAFAPGKRWTEAHYLRGYFQAMTPDYANVVWLPIHRVSRMECARIMAESAIYAAFPLLEGLGLMSVEAMASGCHVVGYTGNGGAEYATPANGDWIAEGDHAGFMARLKDACRLYEVQQTNSRIKAGFDTAAQFSRPMFVEELQAVWLSILGARAQSYRA